MTSPSTILGLGLVGLRLARARVPWPRVSLAERLAALPTRDLPLRGRVRIRWNGHQVPFIEADHDRDLAVALGVVHAHLRLAQVEFMRRAARGRLAEVLGPAALGLDHVLRTVDVARAVPDIGRGLPPETRDWLEGFADGLNAVVRTGAPPPEFAILGFRPAPWTLDDLLAVARLSATDFTWKVWVALLKLRRRPDWMGLWQRMMEGGGVAVPGLAGAPVGPRGADLDLAGMLGAFARSGSNALAVDAGRGAGGHALIASDPHLGVTVPNLWLLAGYRSPGHHAVGMMLPGVPVMALGRNPWIAWGGTSLHAASSDLFDVTDLPPGRFTRRRERVPVRWWRDAAVTVEECDLGPVVSGTPLFPGSRRGGRRLALRWVGHRPSDETTAMLRVNRARDWAGFREALGDYAVPALTMVYADAAGQVGRCLAATLPRRPLGVPADLVLPPEAAGHWRELVTGRDLPAELSPADGIVASANDRPAACDVPVGYFFAPGDRARRLRELVSRGPVTMDDLKAAQRDVWMAAALELRDRLLRVLPHVSGATAGEAGRLASLLAGWDGRYAAEARGPVAFELLVWHVVRALHGRDGAALFANAWEPWELLRQDLERMPPERLARAGRLALAAAARDLTRFASWGDMHRLRLDHPLGALPGVGRRFRFLDAPSPGGTETVMKAAHAFSGGRHKVRLGAVARHVSDMADPDANDFVLLGGQDGWLGSDTALDQVPLWREGRYIRIPLDPAAAARLFPHETVLEPGGGGGA